MRCQRTILVAAAVAALTAAAKANYLILGSSPVTTAVAGGDGTDSRIIGAGGDYQGLYRIDWKEDSDIQCYFRVHTRHLNQDGVQSQDWNLGGASCDETERSERSVGYNKPGLYVNGIRVCRNNQRVKAMEVTFADVGPSGSVTPISVDDRDGAYRPNCGPIDDWTLYRTCPSGMIANQIKVYFRPENPAGFTTN